MAARTPSRRLLPCTAERVLPRAVRFFKLLPEERLKGAELRALAARAWATGQVTAAGLSKELRAP